MNVNELRIGNWVYDTVTKKEVKVAVYVLLKPHEYTPIELSPEILEKCGFEKIPGGAFANAETNYGNPVLYINKYKYLATNGSNMYLFLDGLRITCQYLHQLQNLYFALTGTELNIQL